MIISIVGLYQAKKFIILNNDPEQISFGEQKTALKSSGIS